MSRPFPNPGPLPYSFRGLMDKVEDSLKSTQEWMEAFWCSANGWNVAVWMCVECDCWIECLCIPVLLSFCMFECVKKSVREGDKWCVCVCVCVCVRAHVCEGLMCKRLRLRMGGRRVPLPPKESMGLKRWTEAHREGSVLESQTYIGRGGGRVKPLYKIKSRRRMVITSALEGNRRTRAAKTTSTIKMYSNSKEGKWQKN